MMEMGRGFRLRPFPFFIFTTAKIAHLGCFADAVWPQTSYDSLDAQARRRVWDIANLRKASRRGR
jgi:hypothetical protein